MQDKAKDIYDIDWGVAAKVAADQYARSLQEFIDAVGSENVETYSLNGETISYGVVALKGSKEDFDKLVDPNGNRLEETFGRQYGDEAFDHQLADIIKGADSKYGVACMDSRTYVETLKPFSESVRTIAGITISASSHHEPVIVSDMPELEAGAKTVKFKLADRIRPAISLSEHEGDSGPFLRLTLNV